MRTVNLLDDSLKLVVQPSDLETHFILGELGFQRVEMISQLLYRNVPEYQLSDLFLKLSQRLSETAQSESRYMITRSPLNSTTLLVEFLSAQPLSSMTLLVKNAWFFQVLTQQRLFFNYQPIFELSSGQVVAHECLARALDDKGEQLSGQQLIDAALRMDLTHEFDTVARRACFEALAQICTSEVSTSAQGFTFFVNVLPNAIAQDPQSLEQDFQQVLSLGLRPEQIVFELTEVEALGHHPNLPQLIERIRAWGFGLALDDLSSNVALDHYCMEFHPDVIKLDRRLIHGCSRYALKQVMVKSFLQFAHQLGIMVLAEGLEDREDIELCCELGIDLGQGFGLGSPGRTPWLTPSSLNSSLNQRLITKVCEGVL